jgi:cation diffusion facilitator CzcD-associated flavoprotein CzcO
MPNQKHKSDLAAAPAGRHIDAVVVGAGFGGLYMLHRLRSMGFSVRVYETGSDIGGTWFWNAYPGARCDVESMEYSYQFSEELQQEWEWSERYASQPEILRYLHHVADRFDLRRDIQLNTRVTAAHYDEDSGRWLIETDDGNRVSAQYCVMATGCLSARNVPNIKGLQSFKGATYHTGEWPHEPIDFTGKRVGVIGTGSSAIQSIPMIAEQAKHLYVFQRTPAYSVPAANHPLDPKLQSAIKADYKGFRQRAKQNRAGILFTVGIKSVFQVSDEERQREFETRWANGGIAFLAAYADLFDTIEANNVAAEFIRNKIRSIVKDPRIAELLCPHTIAGCKRLCVDTDYYTTYNRPNVTLVDVKAAPIEEITPRGVKTSGHEYEVDALVLATGFDAMTGALTRIDIRGKYGQRLSEKWEDGPRSYLGIALAGFPNLFTITGPGSPSVLSNMVPSIEQHVEWISDCIDYMREQGHDRIEATREAEDDWVSHVQDIASASVYPSCDSWYLGANIPGKPRVFAPYIGFPQYVEKVNAIAHDGYRGFALTRGRENWSENHLRTAGG